MDISVTVEELEPAPAETVEEAAGGDAALQDGPVDSPGTVSSGDSAGAAGSGIVYIQTAGTDRQPYMLGEQMEHLDYLIEDELLPALREQTNYVRDGFMASCLLLGFTAGACLVICLLMGRR